MNNRVFTVEVGCGGFNAEIDLPATDYEMLDLLDKLRANQDAKIFWEICDYHCTEDMGIEDGSIYELNALAKRLSELDERGWTAFCGLVDMEASDEESTPVSRLLDFAYSTDCCNIAPGVTNDYELGKFYVDNGFIPAYDHLPESVYDDLDYEKIGREMRKSEKGVFVPGSYVVAHDEVRNVAKDMDYTPKAPEYTVLIEASIKDSDKTVMLGLPTTEFRGNDALKQLGADSWDEVHIRCADCRIPQLRDAITQEGTILAANTAAGELEALSDVAALRFKMLLTAKGVTDLDSALELLQDMQDYVFIPQFDQPEDVARDQLHNMLSPDDAEAVILHINLYSYGRELIEEQNITMTDYGAVERMDGQPIERMEEKVENPTMGGMTM